MYQGKEDILKNLSSPDYIAYVKNSLLSQKVVELLKAELIKK